jgi:metal-dependent amidase/aminoacylase/carboxypeptidase family protein
VESTAAAHGCAAKINWMPGYPVTQNDPQETERFLGLATKVLGAENVQRIVHPTMGGEDFAYYGQHVPACFFFLGIRPLKAEHTPALHQPDFDFNDEAIATGVELFCRLALSER